MRLRRKEAAIQESVTNVSQPAETPVSGFKVQEPKTGNTAAPKPPSPPPPPDDDKKIWFVLVAGEQIGPIGAREVLAMLSRKQIDGRAYSWREGMGDWLTLGKIPEFADII